MAGSREDSGRNPTVVWVGRVLAVVGAAAAGLAVAMPAVFSDVVQAGALELPLIPVAVCLLGLCMVMAQLGRAVHVARALALAVSAAAGYEIFSHTQATAFNVAWSPFSEQASPITLDMLSGTSPWFLAAGLAVFLGCFRGRALTGLGQVLAAGIMAVSTLALLVASFESSVLFGRMALGLAFFTVGIGALQLSHDGGLLSWFIPSALARRVLLRLAGAFAALPVLISVAMNAAAPESWSSSIALYAAGILLGMSALVVWAVRTLDRSDVDAGGGKGQEKSLLAAAGIGSWKWDVAEASMDASEQVSAILGLDGPVPEGDSFWTYAHSDDKDAVEAAYERSIESREPYEALHRIVRPDGSVRWIEVHGDVDLDDEGVATSVTGTVIDVTERIEGEQNMEDALKFARRIADSSQDVIYIDDLEKHKRIYANREIGEVLGYSTEQIEEGGERLVWDAVHKDDKERVVEHLRALRTAKDDDVHVVEFRVRRVDGTWACLRRRDMVFQRDGSRPTQVLGVAEDVTAERDAVRLLRESEERYVRVTAHSPGVVFQLRLAADGTASLPYLSPGTKRLLGFAPERIARDPQMLLALVPDEDRFRYYRELVRSSRSLQNFEWTGRFRLGDDDERWIKVSARPSRSDDGSMLWDGLIMDVTEVRAAQQELAESEARYSDLVDSVARDSTERKRIEDDLLKSEERFRVLADSTPAVHALRDSGPAPNGKARILVIEDDEASIRLMEKLFDREQAYEVTIAMTSGLGLELAKKNVPDAIILDADLPDAEGTSVIDAIKDDEDLCGVPVFMLSADASAEQIERFKRAGAAACLTRPVNSGKLLSALEGANVGDR